MMSPIFDYELAFSRNLGWVTEEEQGALRTKRVAIAGLGGVGGHHLTTLARLGIGKFTLAEFDQVEIQNFNRQACARISGIGKDKMDIMVGDARDINSELDLRLFPQGLSAENVDDFLKDVDLYVDGLDFFVLDVRRMIFAKCREKGIPAITAGPLGMGVAYLNFMPDAMSFEEYFDFSPTGPESDNYIKFLTGLSPFMPHAGYMKDWTRADFQAQKVPSTGMACYLCAGVAGVEALKILLGREGVRSVPHTMHFDAYRGKFVHTHFRRGNRSLFNKLMFRLIRSRLNKTAERNRALRS